MNRHTPRVGNDACTAVADQREHLIEDLATLVVLQHRRQQRELVRVDDRQQPVVSKPPKELTETRQDK